MTVFHPVQHAEKERLPGDPGLTGAGRLQAARTADRLHHAGVRALLSSPLRRARETAAAIADRTGLPVQEDSRLRERINWDSSRSAEDFLSDWAATVEDRDFLPACGDSSRAAAERLRACLVVLAGTPGPVALVAHGGVTVDLLRTVIGDAAVPAALMRDGLPSCAITALDGLSVVAVAATAHLTAGRARSSHSLPQRG
ncbi:histidine phosphatase family protein [Streptomyces sp. NPDC088354]|uniref:histidine phosphatase family protein n=1 Tax=unclassified Streptomyces TaxID=2593676 RepID=UPI0029A5365E|nr:histidine phosphatase family protein [Streptomyces sp. MI02-7b]MDX3073948.1 histidine phosphatase family protein [Streptomyces sp. MI02-7b]